MISNFVKNHNTEFYSDCTSLHSNQQWMSVSFIPHPCLHELSLGLFGLLLPVFLSGWYILNISSLPDVGLVKIFYHAVIC